MRLVAVLLVYVPRIFSVHVLKFEAPKFFTEFSRFFGKLDNVNAPVIQQVSAAVLAVPRSGSRLAHSCCSA